MSDKEVCKMYVPEDDYECPYCSCQLEDDVNDGKRIKICVVCGKCYEVEEDVKC